MGLFRLGWTQWLLRDKALGGFDGTQILSHVEATVIWCPMVPIKDRPKTRKDLFNQNRTQNAGCSPQFLSTYHFLGSSHDWILEDPFTGDGCLDALAVSKFPTWSWISWALIGFPPFDSRAFAFGYMLEQNWGEENTEQTEGL